MTTSTNLVYLIALPLFSSALLLLLGRKADKWGHVFATLVSASVFLIGMTEFFAMQGREGEARAATQKLFEWISVGSFQVDAALLLDQLSICFVLANFRRWNTYTYLFNCLYVSRPRSSSILRVFKSLYCSDVASCYWEIHT
jgi:NADH-quinone oxidoreductase subunit L